MSGGLPNEGGQNSARPIVIRVSSRNIWDIVSICTNCFEIMKEIGLKGCKTTWVVLVPIDRRLFFQ